MRIRSQSDFVCGLLFVVLGVAVAVIATQYRPGTAARMGPGYFPMLLGTLLAFLGLTLAVPALVVEGEKLPHMPLRPLLMVLLSIAAFGVTLNYLGFVLAVVVLVMVASLATSELRLWEAAAIAVFMAVFSVVVFAKLLGLPLTLWPSH